MKKILIKFILAIVVIPSMVAYSIFYLNKSGFFNIKKIEITLSDKLLQPNFVAPKISELRTRLVGYQNKSLWDLKLGEVRDVVEQNEWIEAVNVVRVWPNSLEVRVQPKNIELLLSAKGGRLFPVTAKGDVLSEVEIKSAPDVVLLNGDGFKSNRELRNKALALTREIPKEGSFSKATISEISYNPKEGFWVRMVSNGMQIKLGDGNYSLKAARVSQVIDYLIRNEQAASAIDADYSKKVLVKVK